MIDFTLYLITDRKFFVSRDSFFAGVEEALRAGVRAIQLREKDLETRDLLEMAGRMRELTNRHHARLFINDRADIALAVDADGVHLGDKGIPPRAARKVAGRSMLIGVSAHTVGQAERAEQEGADFITAGPVYQTPSKLQYGQPLGMDIFGRIHDAVSIPVFAIGGIKKEKLSEVRRGGAFGIALISGILGARDIYNETKEFMRLMKND